MANLAMVAIKKRAGPEAECWTVYQQVNYAYEQ